MKETSNATKFDSVRKRIRRVQDRLGKGGQDIASHLVSNPEDFALFTAAQIANKLGVSEATVVRFATTIGYRSYPEFRQELQHHVKQQLKPVDKLQYFSSRARKGDLIGQSLSSDMEDLAKTAEELSREQMDRAIDLISSAPKVYVLGFRSSFGLAYTLYHHLNQILATTTLIGQGVEALDQLPHLRRGDVLFAISFPRYSAHVIEYVRIAHDRGVKIIALTDSILSPLAELADASLLARSSSRAFANANIGGLALINSVVAGVAMKNKAQSLRSLAELERVLDTVGAVYSDTPAKK